MQIIIDFIAGIGDMLYSGFQWLIGMVQDLGNIASMLVSVLASIPGYFSWVPSEALTVIVAIFGVVAFYKLAGREG